MVIFLCVVVVLVGCVVYLRPYASSQQGGGIRGFNTPYVMSTTEGFTTIAIETATIPKCLFRSPEAQQLLTVMYQMVKDLPPASAKAMAYNEFRTINEKIQCIDADITGLGSGPYSSYQLPFETQQDIVAPAIFVGRCLRNGMTMRDIEVQYAKYIDRGLVLIQTIVDNEAIRKQINEQFINVARKSAYSISFICLSGNATLDKPAGPRDPGYYSPPSLKELSPYSIRGMFQYF